MKSRNREKMTIAMFGQKNCDRSGGVEVVVTELSTRMTAMGHNVTCYNRSCHHVCGKKYDEPKISEYKGVHEKYVPTISWKGLSAVSSSFFASLACAFGKYDIVHIHAEGPAAMCWLPKLFGKRVIVTIHGLDHQRAKWGKKASKYIMMGEKSAVKYADEIIVLSKHIQQYFFNTYRRQTRFIPNGVNAPIWKEAVEIKERFGLDQNSYILFLGRIVPEKGIQYLIDAFRNIRTNKKLVIAGGSSDTRAFADKMKEAARSDSRILFTGFVQGRILEELYSNAYLYTLPSDLEGMPLSLLEAMSYGNCCLTSDIDECASVVGDKAILFHRGDTDDLREKLQMLCDHPEIVKKYKGEAEKYILDNYNWSDVVDRTIQLYRGQYDGSNSAVCK